MCVCWFTLLKYLEDGLGSFLVVCLGFFHSGYGGKLLQVLQDGQSGTFLGQLLAVALTLGRELPHGDTGQEAFHVWGPTLLQHLERFLEKHRWQGFFFIKEKLNKNDSTKSEFIYVWVFSPVWNMYKGVCAELSVSNYTRWSKTSALNAHTLLPTHMWVCYPYTKHSKLNNTDAQTHI